jgi:methionine aminopeptidase
VAVCSDTYMGVQPGVTTDYIDKKVHQMIVDSNAYPSPLTYGEMMTIYCNSTFALSQVGNILCVWQQRDT